MIPKSEPHHSDETGGSGFSLDGLTKRNVFLIGLGIVVLLGVVGDMIVYGKKLLRGAPPVPACVHAHSYYYTPGTKHLPAPGSDSTDARADWPEIVRVKDAARVCTAKNCDSAALANYRAALHGYLYLRSYHTRRLDMEYGDAGLARARRLYQSAADLEIEQGLRERYKAKVFWINEKSADEDVLRILIAKGPEALRPCRKSDYKS
jgi:hypothetical protein